jgi:EAL domain-containing protein (putative c-di-GMP-specific phosphodiesterase class I)
MLTQPGDAAIVRSVVELAGNLGLDVIAEGVEDAATATQLADIGCTTAQGYHWSRPIPADQLLTWHQQQSGICQAG